MKRMFLWIEVSLDYLPKMLNNRIACSFLVVFNNFKMRGLQKMKMLKIFLLFSLLMALSPNYADAHPGRTDGNGGHTCRTNCTEWGLSYGEYHYHNGGKSSTSSSTTVKKSGPSAKEIEAQRAKKAAAKKAAEEKKNKEIAKAEQAGYDVGLKDGYNNTTTVASSKYLGAYNKGYKKGLEKGILKLSNEKNRAYRAGYGAAKLGSSKEVPSVYKTNSFVSASYLEGYERYFIDVKKQK